MDLPLLLKALLLGLVEGLTEFLPISSTGHLILAGDLLGFNDDKAKVFEIVIQTGAMLAVVWEYRHALSAARGAACASRRRGASSLNLALAFLPAAVLGLLFGKPIKAALFPPVPVAMAFILGGFVILWAERRRPRSRADRHVDDMRWRGRAEDRPRPVPSR